MALMWRLPQALDSVRYKSQDPGVRRQHCQRLRVGANRVGPWATDRGSGENASPSRSTPPTCPLNAESLVAGALRHLVHCEQALGFLMVQYGEGETWW